LQKDFVAAGTALSGFLTRPPLLPGTAWMVAQFE
jgi:hypothetical protein